jgi:hypothetical protein
LFTANMYALGSRVFDGDLGMMAEAGTQVFPQAVAVLWQPAVLALVIGVIGVVVRMLVARTPGRTPASPSGEVRTAELRGRPCRFRRPRSARR